MSDVTAGSFPGSYSTLVPLSLPGGQVGGDSRNEVDVTEAVSAV